jgi:hypothetical protein
MSRALAILNTLDYSRFLLNKWGEISPMSFILTEQRGKIFFQQPLPEKAERDFSDALRSNEQQGKVFFRLLRKKFKNTRPKILF